MLTHNIVPHISLHELPYRRTTKRFADVPSMVISQFWFCNGQQLLCLFHIVVECIPSTHDQGKMLVLPNQLLCLVLSTSDQYFVSFQQFDVIHIHRYKNNPFSRCTNKHFQLETFSQPYFTRISSNCLSHNSPANG